MLKFILVTVRHTIYSNQTQILEVEVFPFVNEWEAIEQAPTRKLIKILGNEGLLGIRFSKGSNVSICI